MYSGARIRRDSKCLTIRRAIDDCTFRFADAQLIADRVLERVEQRDARNQSSL